MTRHSTMRFGGLRSVLLLVPVLVLGLIPASLVQVDETELALVLDFGRVARVYREGDAGLHLKWPWQTSWKVDRRLRVLESSPREVLTQDRRNLEVAPFVIWKVSDPVAFAQGAGTAEAAEARLAERVAAAVGAAVGRRAFADFATTRDGPWAVDDAMAEVRSEIAAPALAELGVAIVEVRLRRFNHPLEVRPAVFEVIRSERRRVAASLRAEGEAAYREITSQADRQRDAILAAAEAEAERIRGRGEAEATRVLNDAHGRDPRFYEFLRHLETYRAVLDEKATLILSTSSPLLRLLTEGPSDELAKPPAAGSPSAYGDRP